jgi:hypothetical protein
VFSFAEREQVHAPAARWLQLQRAPSTLFSVLAFSQVQWRAGCLPQEQVASFAQTQPPGRPQQVTGTVEEVGVDIVGWRVVWFGLKVGGLESRRLKVGEWKIGEELKGLGVRWCSEVW